MYEANPYPRWQRPIQDATSRPLGDVLAAAFPGASIDKVADGPMRILVAGCGTGLQALETARRFTGATVLAIDISRASLAYAMRKTRELGLTGIEYRQADLLSLHDTSERFDLVESMGVLHHLREPQRGLRALQSVLKPGGFLRIGLYSELARRAVVRARDFIAARGFAATPDGIRRCRQAIYESLDDELLRQIVDVPDFYSLSGCRDLLFHVMEHRFTWPQVGELVSASGMDFIGVEMPTPATRELYLARFPGDVAMRSLENWHAFETERPWTFSHMYRFWLRNRETS